LSTEKAKSVSEADKNFMKRALTLAERGRGYVSPNPLVGAVVVNEGKVVGEGYHKKFGQAHAEVNALDAAGDKALNATLYVTLEPCVHQGKTEPCVDYIFQAGISRVVIGLIDPNPLVNGKGVEFLRSKGITVQENVLAEKCQELNAGYTKYITLGKPLITLKIAQTLDGRIATNTGHSKWVTNEETRNYSHKLRARHDAIMVGIRTVINDDPYLTARQTRLPSPKRVILDSKLRVPLDANVLSDGHANRTIIVTSNQASKEKVRRIVERGGTVLVLDADENGWIPQESLWTNLAELGITSVYVEGGSAVQTQCLKSANLDQIIIFYAPKILGSGLNSVGDLGIRNMNQALELSDLKIKRLGTDFMITAKYKHEEETQ